MSNIIGFWTKEQKSELSNNKPTTTPSDLFSFNYEELYEQLDYSFIFSSIVRTGTYIKHELCTDLLTISEGLVKLQ